MLADKILLWIGRNPAAYADRDKWIAIEVWLSHYYPPFFAIGFAAYPWIKLWLQYKKRRQKITRQQLIKAVIFSIILGFIGYWAPGFLWELAFGISLRSL